MRVRDQLVVAADLARARPARDRRPEEIIRSEFPAFDDFTHAYIARFPKTAKLLGPGVAKVQLKLSSTRGGIEMTWP